MNIYFDLDGTLIDVSGRFYRIYCDLLAMFNCKSKLSKDEYWQLKREKCPEEEIVRRTCKNIDIQKYRELRMTFIESPKYLKYDRPFSYTFDVIKKLKTNHRLIIVSLRESYEKTEMELDHLGMKSFFDKILVHNEDVDEMWRIKADLIKSDSSFDRSSSVVVGDTEADFFASKAIGIPCFLVVSGIRTREYLTTLGNASVIDDISQLKI